MVKALRYVGKYVPGLLTLAALALFFDHMPGEPWLETVKRAGAFLLQAGFLFCAVVGLILIVMDIVDHYRQQ